MGNYQVHLYPWGTHLYSFLLGSVCFLVSQWCLPVLQSNFLQDLKRDLTRATELTEVVVFYILNKFALNLCVSKASLQDYWEIGMSLLLRVTNLLAVTHGPQVNEWEFCMWQLILFYVNRRVVITTHSCIYLLNIHWLTICDVWRLADCVWSLRHH